MPHQHSLFNRLKSSLPLGQFSKFYKQFIVGILLFSLTFAGLQFAKSKIKVNAGPNDPLTVTINQSTSQTDPTTSPNVKFTAVFSEAIDVSSFGFSDVILTGTATDKVINSITQITPNDGTTFEIDVSATNTGTIIATIPQSQINYTSNILGTTGVQPNGIKLDSLGNIYTANYGSNNVTQVTQQGVSTIFATTDLGPNDLTIDNLDNVYTINSLTNFGGTIYNYSNSITKITPQGATTTYNNVGLKPNKIISDNLGNLYVVDNQSSYSIFKISPQGVVSTFYTNPSMSGGSGIIDIKIDSNQNIYFATNYYYYNSKYEVIKITPQGVSSLYGSFDYNIAQIVLDSAGNVFASRYDYQIQKVTPQGASTIFYSGNRTLSMTIDSQDNIYTGDYPSNNITKINPQGVSTSITNPGSRPTTITVDNQGNIYTANNQSNNVTKITKNLVSGIKSLGNKTNQVSTSIDNSISFVIPIITLPSLPLAVAINQSTNQPDPTTNSQVNFTVVFSEPIDFSSFDASDIVLTGTATGKSVSSITQIAPNDNTTFEIEVVATSSGTIIADIPKATYTYSDSIVYSGQGNLWEGASDNLGNQYFIENAANKIIKIDTSGNSSTFASLGSGSSDITVDQNNNIYATSDNGVSKITPDGTVTTYTTSIPSPYHLAVDQFGNMYTSHWLSGTGDSIVKTTPANTSNLFAYSGGSRVESLVFDNGILYAVNANGNTVTKIDTNGNSLLFGTTGQAPFDIDFDSQHNAYVVNQYDYRLSKITPDGNSTFFGGNFESPFKLTIDSEDNIYTVDYYSGRVYKTATDGVARYIGKGGRQTFGITSDMSGNIYVSSTQDKNITKLSKTLNTGVKTLSGKINQTSTSLDNSITFELPYTLGSYVGPLTGDINNYFPIIFLTDSNVPDGTPASFFPAGSSQYVSGTIQYGYFTNNNGQAIPFDATIGPAVGVLSTSITPSINVATDFSTPQIVGNFSVPNPTSISYDDNHDAIVRYELNFNRGIYVDTFTADDVSFGFYQGCSVVIISPFYSSYYSSRFDVVLNCGHDPVADGEYIYPQIEPGKVSDGNLTNNNVADRGTLATLKYLPNNPITVDVPSVINSTNYTNFAITGSCVAGFSVYININLSGESGVTPCHNDNTYSYTPEMVIYSSYTGCSVNYYDSCNYIATAFQNLDPNSDTVVYTGTSDYGIFDNYINGTINSDNSTVVNGINYIFAQPNYYDYYCGDAQSVSLSINGGPSFVENCNSASSYNVNFLNRLPSPLVNGPITISGTSTDLNGNTQTINQTTEVCLDPNYNYYQYMSFFSFGSIKASAQSVPDCTPIDPCSSSSSSSTSSQSTPQYYDYLEFGSVKAFAQTAPDCCPVSTSSSSSSSQIFAPSGFLDLSILGGIKAAAQTISCSSSSSSSSSLDLISSSSDSSTTSSSTSSDVASSSSIGSSSAASSSADTNNSSTSSDVASSSIIVVESSVSSSLSSESCVVIVPLVPDCNNSNSSSSTASSELAVSSRSSEVAINSSSEQVSSSSLAVISSSVVESSILISSSFSSSVVTSSSQNSVVSSGILSSSSTNAISSSSLVSDGEDGDGVPKAIENQAPNSGDGNNDGILDSTQSDVASTLDSDSEVIVTVEIQSNSVEINPCKTLQNVTLTKEIINQKLDEGFDYPAGFVNFESNCPTSMRVKIYWYGLDLTKNYVNRKFRTNGQTYDFVENVLTKIENINGQDVMSYTYTVVDNGPLDEDPIVGKIKDPIGPAIPLNNSGGGMISIYDTQSSTIGKDELKTSIKPNLETRVPNSNNPSPIVTQNDFIKIQNETEYKEGVTIRTGGLLWESSHAVIILMIFSFCVSIAALKKQE
jgi:hypothetical protein